MDFILNEAEIESNNVILFSDDEEEDDDYQQSVEDRLFINDDTSTEQESRSFYRDLNNRENYLTFQNQTKNPVEVMQERTKDYFGNNDLPELYEPEERKQVEFDSFDKDHQKAKKLKDSLICFSDEVENPFFYLIIYGLMFHKLKVKKKVKLECVREVLGNDLYFDLKKIKNDIM